MARFVFALSAAVWMATVVTAVNLPWPGAPGPAVAAHQAAAPRLNRTARLARALLDRYCVTCHNQRLKTGGLSLDTVDPVEPR